MCSNYERYSSTVTWLGKFNILLPLPVETYSPFLLDCRASVRRDTVVIIGAAQVRSDNSVLDNNWRPLARRITTNEILLDIRPSGNKENSKADIKKVHAIPLSTDMDERLSWKVMKLKQALGMALTFRIATEPVWLMPVKALPTLKVWVVR